MAHRRTGASPLAALVAVAAAGLALVPGVVGAAVWDTYTNANALNSVNAVGGAVWCASDVGLHRYDPGPGRFTRFAKSSGELVSNAVTEVEVDAAGNAWFATRGGGVSVRTPSGAWRTLTVFDGLPSGNVLCLEPSALGMWVGTDAGVALFDGFELAAVWPDGVNDSPFTSSQGLDIAIVGDSTWVGTPDGAYVTKSSEGLVWARRVAGLGGTRVEAVTATASGEVWCVAGNRVYRGGETGAWTLAEQGLPAVASYHLRARGDTLLLGTGGGVYRRIGGGDWALLGVGFPSQAWVDFADDGVPWAGNVEGLWSWDGAAWRRLDIPGPGGNWVHGMALEGSRCWIATRDRGIARFDGTSWRTFAPQAGALPDTSLLSADFIFTMFVDSRGAKWAGDWDGSIARLDDSGPIPSFTHFYAPFQPGYDRANTFGWSAAEAPDGAVWFGLDTAVLAPPPTGITPLGLHRIGTNGSLATYNPSNGAAMTNSQVRTVAFAPGPSFEMWVGYARNGIDIFTDPTLATRSGRISELTAEGGLIDDDVWCVQFNGDSVWVGTSSGLNRYSRATRQRRETIGTQPASDQGAVNPLSIDAEGGVWWATKAGLYHRRPDRSVEVFTAANSPLLSDNVHTVAVDRATGDVWIGTEIGVNRYRPNATPPGATPAAGRFTTYPNPAYLSAAGVRLRSNDVSGAFEGRVYDVRGRVLRRLRGNASTTGLWDATDEEGRRVAPGLYLIAVTQSGVTRTSRVLLVR